MQNIRDYRIISLLGEGGMGKVYLAEDETLGRKVAIKILDHSLGSNPDLIERFKQEARAQANLHHPNIITLHTYFEENGNHCIVLEYVNGMTLKQTIREKGALKENEALEIFYQILDGVGEAHQMGIVHRDLKPSNIMIDVSGRVKIMDFGIAKILGDRGMTKTGHKMGTMFYMSPEQVRAQKDIDQKTDIYSLGIVLFEMLTGKVPFDTNTESDYEVMDAIVKGNLKLETLKPAGISENLISVITRMTAVERNERFPTCLKVREGINGPGVHVKSADLKSPVTVDLQSVRENKPVSVNTHEQEKRRHEVTEAHFTKSDNESVFKDQKRVSQPGSDQMATTHQSSGTEGSKPSGKKPVYFGLGLIGVIILIIVLSKKSESDFTVPTENETVSREIDIKKSNLSFEQIKEMIFVGGGTFRMGSNNGDDDEKPVHSVTLSDFFIGKYEVTQGLWKSVTGNNPSRFTGDDNLPVENLSWYDAVEFCNKLSEKEGLQKVYSGSGDNITMNMNANGYRLPTEAEWEYAARGGSLSKGYEYSGSNNTDDVAWYWDNSGRKSGRKTHPVGQKQPNELGIYDMSGNVLEWCWDWYGSYGSDSQTNPTGPSSGSFRVGRGGSWRSNAGRLRPANRFYDLFPDDRDNNLGFRLLRTK